MEPPEQLEDDFVYGDGPYPVTCVKCPFRGEIRVIGENVPFKGKEYALTGRYEWHTVAWPDRCRKCNARKMAKQRAKKSILRLEEIRDMTEVYCDTFYDDNSERWKYLKFVTLTWKNESVSESEPDMRSARKWLNRKRTKISKKLDAIAGNDVLECVTTKNDDGTYRHHIHSHGVWVMPKHDIKKIESVMRLHQIGRDQVRACTEKLITPEYGDAWMLTAPQRAAVYLAKTFRS